MPDIRLFTDEQISNAVTLGLRQRGVEVLSAPDAGLGERLDGRGVACAGQELDLQPAGLVALDDGAGVAGLQAVTVDVVSQHDDFQ